MAWWSSVSSVSRLAHTALKEAQRKLDKVLDIDEDVPPLGDQSLSSFHVYSDFDGNVSHLSDSAETFPDLATSLGNTTSKRDRQASSSLSSGLMPESEDAEEFLESAVHEQVRPQSALSSSLAADQGDACNSMEMSTSGTLAIEAPPPPKPPSSIEDNVNSKEIEEKTEEESIKGEVEGSLENLPKQATSSLLKSRVDDESGGTTTSSEIEVISTYPNASLDVLYQRLSEATKLLEAREAKLVEICGTNLSLQEVNEFLHTKLEEAGLPHDFNTADLQSLTDEFTERLSTTEKKLQAASRERDQLKAQLASATKSTELNLKRSYDEHEKVLKSRCVKLEATLAEKEAQLADLLSEGNRMAQEQLKTNNLVKTLRSKTKTLESEKEKINDNLTKAQAEIDSLKSDLSILRDNEIKLQESFNQMTRKNLKLEKEVSVVKVELEASKEKAEALNRVRLELVNKLSESTEGLASAQAALIEAKTRGEAIRDVEEEQQTLRDEVSTLRAQLDEARVAAARQKVEADQRLQQVRQEVEHYREQLAGSESRLESLGETTTSVVKPLLQQIQSLQSKLNDQTKTFEDTEHSLLSQITDFKKRLEAAERTDRQFQDRINEAETAADALRLELTLERENSSRLHDRISQYNLQASADKIQLERLHSELDSLHQQITALEDSRDSANSALTAEREELMNLRAELNKTKSELAHALSNSSLLTTTVAATSHSPTSSEIQPPRPSNLSSSSHILAETLTGQSSPSSPSVSQSSVMPTGHFASSLSFLQSQLRQREGEVGQLRREVARLNEKHEHLLAELSEQSAKAESRLSLLSLEVDVEGKSLSQRYEVLLQLYALNKNMGFESAVALYC
ncbi:unnamed protein product [Hymenolepis diminuta]|uniref:TMF_TATA_bd domain-containing protein n=1 Tax=Hymenolepis diminuta TaxID=6216 RepID=A0A158QFW2_HYMDI|nr:unnamed protein product [Hymenolepis diminuta]